MKDVSNQYAAMPSMHIGWATWSAIVLAARWCGGAGRKVLVVAYPVLTLVCIVLTANHYWIDGLGGLLCLGVGYALGAGDHAARARARDRDARLTSGLTPSGSTRPGGRGSRPWRATAPRPRARS